MIFGRSYEKLVLGLLLTPWLLGCAQMAHKTPDTFAHATTSSQAATVGPSSEDRDAILAMVGEFDVTFQFDETVALAPAYQPGKLKEEQAKEVVILVEDHTDHIVLQHLLIVGGQQVIKHWRQDWTWQASHRFEYSDEQTWDYVALQPSVTDGRWTQCVYGVVDTPRYCGTGQWNHRYGNATWTSDRSWRPLPRRDYSIRDDYSALNVENRHTITPTGWTHEQDNTKVIRIPGQPHQPLVREFGFNEYLRHSGDFDFSAAYAYWDNTKEFWADVRALWAAHLKSGQIKVDTGRDGEPIISELFALATNQAITPSEQASKLSSIFKRHVEPYGNTALAFDGQ